MDSHVAVAAVRAPNLSIRAADVYGDDQLKQHLKQFHIQQYYKKLVELGFKDNIWKLTQLSDRQIDDFCAQLRLLPGHLSKFMEMLSAMRLLSQLSRERRRRVNVVRTAVSLSPQHSTPERYHRAMS